MRGVFSLAGADSSCKCPFPSLPANIFTAHSENSPRKRMLDNRRIELRSASRLPDSSKANSNDLLGARPMDYDVALRLPPADPPALAETFHCRSQELRKAVFAARPTAPHDLLADVLGKIVGSCKCAWEISGEVCLLSVY